ncbi:Peptide chain release factor RF1 [Pseudobythopirellula maris]|uniref:Peptide chain release factor 1 n=1 Tax=Pseudobythopirellula maris TaxID=2527991 RepID=A0A5C5ZFJ6_9BACT|nr:peptide chain release factor 1 [Pseudobythopirellula maris]TWT86154.1 Peptide chain release factor RF1 [Pseudobythopirellula maris]
MRELLESKLARFEQLERDLVDPAVLSDSGRLAQTAREHGSLTRLAGKYRRFCELTDEIAATRELAEGDDADMRELAEAELPALIDEREVLWDELLGMTLGGDDANRTRCIMEIRAGTGGDEAALFARDLYEMYKRHAETKRWKIEVMDMSATELGGFKDLSLAFEGDGVYRELQYESGGHRVQRVPETETQGRIHTSAATVAVMAEPEDLEIDIKPEDYRLDKFCASGPGGQHVNKTESAVRLTHHETGIVVQCQDEKSQHKNLAKALRVLKSRVYDKMRELEDQKRADERKGLVGSGDRSQRIRTYNFPDNRLTDHRIGLSLYKLDQILAGSLQMVTDALIDYDRQQIRDQMGGLD